MNLSSPCNSSTACVRNKIWSRFPSNTYLLFILVPSFIQQNYSNSLFLSLFLSSSLTTSYIESNKQIAGTVREHDWSYLIPGETALSIQEKEPWPITNVSSTASPIMHMVWISKKTIFHVVCKGDNKYAKCPSWKNLRHFIVGSLCGSIVALCC